MSHRTVLTLLATIAAGLLSGHPAVEAATAPAQPRSGPGGISNPDAQVMKRGVGRASAGVYAFHLAGEATEARPVVVFLPAWGAVNPAVYGGWIDHLARKGNLVLWPVYQEVGRTRPADATERAATLVKSALAELANDTSARPDLARLTYLGHSAGVGVAANLAAQARVFDLPVPRLLFLTMPGGIASDAKSRGIPLEDLAQIDPSTAVITMIGDREATAADRVSRRILREASSVPPARKLFMRAGSDDHGFPMLTATLASPAAPMDGYDAGAIKLPADPPLDPKAPRPQRPRWSADMVLSGEQTILVQSLQRNVVDTLDYLAFWRSFDMAQAASFAGTDMATLRADAAFLDMGRWTDGWPVRRLAAETPKAEPPKPAVPAGAVAAGAAAGVAGAAAARAVTSRPATSGRGQPARPRRAQRE